MMCLGFCSLVLNGSPIGENFGYLQYERALTGFWCFLSVSITILGTGAKWLSVLEEKDMRPGKHLSLSIRPWK